MAKLAADYGTLPILLPNGVRLCLGQSFSTLTFSRHTSPVTLHGNTSVHMNVENFGKKEPHSDGAEKDDNDDDRLRLPCDEA